jgi:hypothetical protein
MLYEIQENRNTKLINLNLVESVTILEEHGEFDSDEREEIYFGVWYKIQFKMVGGDKLTTRLIIGKEKVEQELQRICLFMYGSIEYAAISDHIYG